MAVLISRMFEDEQNQIKIVNFLKHYICVSDLPSQNANECSHIIFKKLFKISNVNSWFYFQVINFPKNDVFSCVLCSFSCGT